MDIFDENKDDAKLVHSKILIDTRSRHEKTFLFMKLNKSIKAMNVIVFYLS
jgi:hypothetical protein